MGLIVAGWISSEVVVMAENFSSQSFVERPAEMEGYLMQLRLSVHISQRRDHATMCSLVDEVAKSSNSRFLVVMEILSILPIGC